MSDASTPRPELPQRLSARARLGILGAGMGGSLGTYSVINLRMAETELTRTLPTVIDALVPFQASAVFVYGGVYSLALAPACLVQDRRLLLRGLVAYSALLLAGVPFWLLWPVTVPRSPVPVTDLSTWAVAVMRWIDPPANCFPSMHVGETVLAAMLCGALDRRLGAVMGVLALGVWWSTLALDQHWFLDGLAGASLAGVLGAWVIWWRPLPAVAFVPRSRWHLGWAVGLYVVLFLAGVLPWWLGWADGATLPP